MITMFPFATLVNTEARKVSWAAVAMLRGVFRSEHGTSLIECRKRVALTNQSGKTTVSFWETIYQLKDQTMIVHKRTHISQLVREHLKKLTVSRDIGKILHASVREFLLKTDSPNILIVLKNVSQTILVSHISGVWL